MNNLNALERKWLIETLTIEDLKQLRPDLVQQIANLKESNGGDRVQQWLRESASGGNQQPGDDDDGVTEEQLAESFRGLVSPGQELAAARGRQPSGMLGESSRSDDDDDDGLDEAGLVEAFRELGLSESEAKIAAQGRSPRSWPLGS